MIEVGDLHFKYAGSGVEAVRGVSFRVDKGEIFGFLGPNGAGKSTTQKILIRLLRGYHGDIDVMGRDLKSWGQEYFEHIGVSFELPNHYRKLTALENLEFFRSLYSGDTEDPRKLLAAVELEGDANTRVAQFSKGMQMRLNFARALLNRPKVIFLDEPTSGLDPVSARRIKGMIRHQKEKGHTVFLTTHDMAVADELCDRVAFIVDGTIALTDSPRELRIRWGERRVRVEFRANGRTDRREFPVDGLGSNEEFLALLRGEEIETIHTKEATLEDVFIQVTGRSLV